MISPAEALRIVLAHARPLGSIRRPLEEAVGWHLAEDVRADRDMPPADRAAMDGYAVQARDITEVPQSLQLVGEVPAGSAPAVKVTRGSCVRILTGAVLPRGADAVVMVEYTEQRGRQVVFRCQAAPGENILRQGEDARRGCVLLRKGAWLGPAQIGVCAAVGKVVLRVHRQPRVALLCTGQELLEPAARRALPHQTRNSNGLALSAAMQVWGLPPVACRVLPDDLNALTLALAQAAAEHDVLLLTGGASVGKYDFVRQAVDATGARIHFHGVAMKPGKPCLYASLPRNRHIFGLPGNPLSAMTGFHEFALPAMQRLAGVPQDLCHAAIPAQLAEDLASKGGRTRFVLGRIAWCRQGASVEPVQSQSSSDLAAAGRADGVIVVPADTTRLAAGEDVEFHPWRPLP